MAIESEANTTDGSLLGRFALEQYPGPRAVYGMAARIIGRPEPGCYLAEEIDVDTGEAKAMGRLVLFDRYSIGASRRFVDSGDGPRWMLFRTLGALQFERGIDGDG